MLAMLTIAFGTVLFAVAPPITVTAESETVVLLSVVPQVVEDYIRINPDAVLVAMGMKVIERGNESVKVKMTTLRHSWEFTLKETEDKDKSEFKAVMIEANKGGIVDAENKIVVVADRFGSRVTINTKATISERGVTANEVKRELVKAQKGLSSHLRAKFNK
jgi:hypothetical protein